MTEKVERLTMSVAEAAEELGRKHGHRLHAGSSGRLPRPLDREACARVTGWPAGVGPDAGTKKYRPGCDQRPERQNGKQIDNPCFSSHYQKTEE